MRNKISIAKTTYQDITIRESDRVQIAIETLLEINKLNDDHFIDNGQLMEWNDIRGSLSRDFVRPATALDIQIFAAIKLIQDNEKRKKEAAESKSPAQLKKEIAKLQNQLEMARQNT
jgi:hypothetical protein